MQLPVLMRKEEKQVAGRKPGPEEEPRASGTGARSTLEYLFFFDLLTCKVDTN